MKLSTSSMASTKQEVSLDLHDFKLNLSKTLNSQYMQNFNTNINNYPPPDYDDPPSSPLTTSEMVGTLSMPSTNKTAASETKAKKRVAKKRNKLKPKASHTLNLSNPSIPVKLSNSYNYYTYQDSRNKHLSSINANEEGYLSENELQEIFQQESSHHHSFTNLNDSSYLSMSPTSKLVQSKFQSPFLLKKSFKVQQNSQLGSNPSSAELNENFILAGAEEDEANETDTDAILSQSSIINDEGLITKIIINKEKDLHDTDQANSDDKVSNKSTKTNQSDSGLSSLNSAQLFFAEISELIKNNKNQHLRSKSKPHRNNKYDVYKAEKRVESHSNNSPEQKEPHVHQSQQQQQQQQPLSSLSNFASKLGNINAFR
jgi:hypothetical protein